MRVSTQDQNLENQRQKLKQFAELKDWQVVGEYTDKISGSKDSRPGLDKLVQQVQKRRIDVVLAWKLDRLGRDRRHLDWILSQFNHFGTEICFTDQFIDTTTHEGRFFWSILSALAELERGYTSDRIKLAHARARKEGKVIGRPSWRTKYKPEQIEYLKALILEGGHSLNELSKLSRIPRSTVNKIKKEMETDCSQNPPPNFPDFSTGDQVVSKESYLETADRKNGQNSDQDFGQISDQELLDLEEERYLRQLEEEERTRAQEQLIEQAEIHWNEHNDYVDEADQDQDQDQGAEE
jgi:DNA invertase Pin-like site-specific DNA recombinase